MCQKKGGQVMNPKMFQDSLKNYYEFILNVLNECISEKETILDVGLKQTNLTEEEKEKVKVVLSNYIEALKLATKTTDFLLLGLKEFDFSAAKNN